MIRKSKSVYVLVVVLVLVLSLSMLTGCNNTQQAQTPAQKPAEKPSEKPYFEGKTITIIVPNSPGGGHDTAARTIEPYIKKYSGAKNVLVENVKGAGGILGMNKLWTSKADGTYVMFASAVTHLLSYIAGDPSVQWDPTKTTWLARVNQQPRLFHVGKKIGINNVEELKKMGRQFKLPATGLDDDFYTTAVVLKSLGIEMKTVTGFAGDPECHIAEIQGSVDGMFTTFPVGQNLIKTGDVLPIMVLSRQRQPEYPNIPTVLEITTGEGKQVMEAISSITEMFQSLWGPPNMDPKAKAEWDVVMKKVLEDPEVIEKFKKLGFTPAYKPGNELQKDVVEAIKATPLMKPIFAEAAASVK